MRLRRTMAAVAATAAIVPAALLTATAAAAGDSPTGPAETTVTGGGTTGDTTTGGDTASTGSTTGGGTSTDGGTATDGGTSTDGGSTSGDTTGGAATGGDTTSGGAAGDATGSPSGSPPVSSSSASASASPSGSPSQSASPSPVPSTGLDCTNSDDADPSIDENLTTSITGLPSKIAAGSGWHNFKLNVDNSSDQAYTRVDLGLFALALDNKLNDSTRYLTLQWQDPQNGEWVDISLDENDEGAGYIGWTNVDPNEDFSLNVRLAVSKKAPAGYGFAFSVGVYANDKGQCVYTGGDAYWEFDVLAAGADPGNPGAAKPQTGEKTPISTKPAGDTEIGSLADTGSSSALPVIALVGGATVAVGGGAMFVVRRRKVGSEA
jgi:LPXTG-motif cell wall-anchored protein